MDKKYTKLQRIFAIVGVILLLLLYIVTLICAVFATPATLPLFKACILSTVLIPLMIFGYIKIGRILTRRSKKGL